jgi:outer membrane protein OmpA-like peptidoglycan-associated protein
MKRLLPALALLALSVTAHAGMPPSDLEGAKDSPLVKRYEGSLIVRYKSVDFDEYQLILGKRIRKDDKWAFEKTEDLEGRVTRISYYAPPGRSTLEVFRNYESALKADGYEIMFSGRKDALGESFSNVYDGDFFGQLFFYSPEESSYLAAKKDTPAGPVHVALFVTAFQFGATNHVEPDKGQVIVQLDVIEGKPMEQKMVTVSAGEMDKAIAETGKVALYDILFDTGKSDIKPESTAALEQIAKLLGDQPKLNLLVVGHTDNEGGYDFNLKLSVDRAQAVVTWLEQNKGIAASRLRPAGAGYLCPVASNHTDEGRAKNRRVELVEQ